MAYPKLLVKSDVLQAAIEFLETNGTTGISLRAVAARLGVKAPSLYRYFSDKAALEYAIVEAGSMFLFKALANAIDTKDGPAAFHSMAEAYLQFARTRPSLYFFMTEQSIDSGALSAGKDLWNLVLSVVERKGGSVPDPTSSAVAVWAFLHGFARLESTGRFGASGPHQAFQLGLDALASPQQPKRTHVQTSRTPRKP